MIPPKKFQARKFFSQNLDSESSKFIWTFQILENHFWLFSNLKIFNFQKFFLTKKNTFFSQQQKIQKFSRQKKSISKIYMDHQSHSFQVPQGSFNDFCLGIFSLKNFDWKFLISKKVSSTSVIKTNSFKHSDEKLV